MTSSDKRKKLLTTSFFISVLFALHFAIPMYVISTFLGKYINPSYIGFIYSLAGVIAIIIGAQIGKFIKQFHSYRTSLYILFGAILVTILLPFVHNIYIIIFLLCAHIIFISLFTTMLNYFIEDFDDDAKTGQTRGIHLTLLNTGILFSPLLAESILSRFSFYGLWISSGLCLLPIMYLIRHNYKNIKDPVFKNPNTLLAIKKIIKDKNIFAIFISVLSLECFYITMAIYAPTVLKTNLNISIQTYLSVLLPFALLPFVIFPYHLGKIADKNYGEKEILIIGLIILTLTTFIFPNLTNLNLFTVAIFLFISRAGASLIETMCEVYFYKKVTASQISTITLFSQIRLMSYLIMPLISSIILILNIPISYVFYILGLIFIFALHKVRFLIDTK